MSHRAKCWGDIESAYALALQHEPEELVGVTNGAYPQQQQQQSQQQQQQQQQEQNVQWELARQKVARFRLHGTCVVSAVSAVSAVSTVSAESLIPETVLHLPNSHSSHESLLKTADPNRKPPRESFLILPCQCISTIHGRNYRRDPLKCCPAATPGAGNQ
jgi:hypothetical protein